MNGRADVLAIVACGIPAWCGGFAMHYPRSQFQHPPVAKVGDINVATRVHRHTRGIVELGERQHGLRSGPRRQLHHPAVAPVGDIDVTAAVHRDTPEAVEPGERQHAWAVAPTASFSTRLLPLSAM